MLEYLAYMLDHDGQIKLRIGLICGDEEAAKERAKQLVDRHDVELWQGSKKIATFHRLNS